MFATGIKCVKCGAEYPLGEGISVCSKCQGLLDVQYDYDRMQQEFSARAFLNGHSKIVPVERPETVAEGLAVGNPPKGDLVLDAIRKSSGAGETVDDDEILKAARDLATKEGQFVEVSAAASVAGAIKLLDKGVINRKERIVCELTGTGLKSIKEYGKVVSSPHLVDPNIESLERALAGRR